MMAAAEKLKAAGIQPFAASGEQKWPLTRLINGYVARKYGADAMARVAKGDLKVTDAGFVEAAKAIQDMGKKGYFGAAVNTLDYGTAQDLFLQGKAGMFYMGSWALSSLNDPKQNKIGAENVGFFNFPTVPGGKGTRNEWSLNTGIATAINPKQNDEALGGWLKYVFANYGDRAMADNGQISGFKVNKLPANLPQLTKDTLKKLGAAKNAYLWFEAKLSPKASSVASDNVQLLVTGDMSPENYTAELQKALN
jgi:raffinose/stachyose/melibiose transport system substrate-binding protein